MLSGFGSVCPSKRLRRAEERERGGEINLDRMTRIKELLNASILGAVMALAPEALAAERVVTTTNNDNPPSGALSLEQALTGLSDGDVIKFNIPGDGPHFIATPVGGYPLITASNITIDGYSQPGASPNSNPILGGNNARIQIVLDSSNDASAPSQNPENPLLLERRSTRLPFSGYGDTENAILGVLGGDNFAIQGVGFIARRTVPSSGAEGDENVGSTSVSDPAIYAIALIQEATNAKVQGCWFGARARRNDTGPGEFRGSGLSAPGAHRHLLGRAGVWHGWRWSE
jgi:hypothetical protein